MFHSYPTKLACVWRQSSNREQKATFFTGKRSELGIRSIILFFSGNSILKKKETNKTVRFVCLERINLAFSLSLSSSFPFLFCYYDILLRWCQRNSHSLSLSLSPVFPFFDVRVCILSLFLFFSFPFWYRASFSFLYIFIYYSIASRSCTGGRTSASTSCGRRRRWNVNLGLPTSRQPGEPVSWRSFFFIYRVE